MLSAVKFNLQESSDIIVGAGDDTDFFVDDRFVVHITCCNAIT